MLAAHLRAQVQLEEERLLAAVAPLVATWAPVPVVAPAVVPLAARLQVGRVTAQVRLLTLNLMQVSEKPISPMRAKPMWI